IHPDTDLPYTWPDGELTDQPASELPVITPQHVTDMFAYFESIVPADWTRKERVRVRRHPNGSSAVDHAPGANQKAAPWLVIAALAATQPEPVDDRDEWLRVGAGAHHATDGDHETYLAWD